MIGIEELIPLIKDRNYVIVDTRTPKEFEEDHICGAVNIPLLENSERAEVGILYKNFGKEKAVKKGYELVNPKLDDMLKKYMNIGRDKKFIIYCWRGGMRSGSVTEWLISHGFDAMQLGGGYKEYRRYVREKLLSYDLKTKLFVIKGLTGTGKTKYLRETSLPFIDLEGMAEHRSSVFGSLGLKPKSQKMFETQLFFTLEELGEYALVEGESRKVGNVELPEFLYKSMMRAPIIIFDVSLDTRVSNIIEDYGEIADFDKDELRKIVNSIKKKISKETYNSLMKSIDGEETYNFVRELLVNYYDPLYEKHIEKHNSAGLVIKPELENDIDGKIKEFVGQVTANFK